MRRKRITTIIEEKWFYIESPSEFSVRGEYFPGHTYFEAQPFVSEEHCQECFEEAQKIFKEKYRFYNRPEIRYYWKTIEEIEEIEQTE